MKILIIDDEKNIRISLTGILEDEGYEVEGCGNITEAESCLEEVDPDLVLLDVKLPDGNGIDLLARIKKIMPFVPVLMISGHSSISDAVRAIKIGAFDFLEKPLSLPKVKIAVKKAIEFYDISMKLRRFEADSRRGWRMIGKSEPMQELNELINRVAPSNAKILIQGESGTGKELIARQIHRLSARHDKAFVKFNSAAIPRELIESELFGFEKGAFTGAVARKKGRLEEADMGTLFLDEIGDMEPAAQAKILRVIQEGEFERVGGNQTKKIDVRIIAATNRNLPKMVEEGLFREDLYYRLNVVPIISPPLRQRKSDIPLLIDHFAKEMALELAQKPKHFAEDALALLMDYDFPGNVRELRNIIERIYLLTDKEETTAEELRRLLSIKDLKQKNAVDFWQETAEFREKRREFERRYLGEQLEKYEGNISKTAEALGLQQGNLSRKLAELGIRGD
jgi:two-component system nitrogen regulation response regulator NtrX